jgi:hypothetical protein
LNAEQRVLSKLQSRTILLRCSGMELVYRTIIVEGLTNVLLVSEVVEGDSSATFRLSQLRGDSNSPVPVGSNPPTLLRVEPAFAPVPLPLRDQALLAPARGYL